MAWKWLHWPAIQELNDYYQIVAVCNRTKSDAVIFAREINLNQENVYDDYKEMLKRNDIDAVDVMVPIPENFDIYHNIVKANINLIAEKPLASTMEGAEKLLRLHKKHPVNIMVAENYRYNDEINKIRDIIIKQKKIGDIIYFINYNAADFENQMPKNTFATTEWRQHPEFKGGTFLDAGLHDIAAMRHIFGKVEYVYAMGQPQQEDFSPYISVNSQIKFFSGVIGQYSYYTDGKETQRPLIGFRIFGSKGEVYLEERKCGTINVTYRDGSSEQIPYQPERGYYNELLNFYNSLLENEKIAVTPEIEYGDVKMVFNLLKSIKDNKPYPVDMKTNEVSLV